MGRDHLEALAVGTHAARLEQQVALLGQQLAAQRCVASFLGAHEVPLRREVAALRQVRGRIPFPSGCGSPFALPFCACCVTSWLSCRSAGSHLCPAHPHAW